MPARNYKRVNDFHSASLSLLICKLVILPIKDNHSTRDVIGTKSVVAMANTTQHSCNKCLIVSPLLS